MARRKRPSAPKKKAAERDRKRGQRPTRDLRQGRRPAPAPTPLTHIDQRGEARMVDVSDKDATERIAIAEGRVLMRKETLDIVLEGNAMKGDVLGAARLAGIMAAKRTHGLIPLCHPLPLTKVEIDINPEHSTSRFPRAGDRESDREDRRRNGGADRSLDRVPDDLRHGQGSGTRHAHRGHPPSAQKRRQIG